MRGDYPPPLETKPSRGTPKHDVNVAVRARAGRRAVTATLDKPRLRALVRGTAAAAHDGIRTQGRTADVEHR